ncbi:MAG: alanine racemase [Gemmatimonadota bacterium]
MSTDPRNRAWLEVDASAIRANFLAVRSAVGEESRIVAMVKADAYGLGALETVRTLEPLGPWGYGVATVEEGAQLRRAGIQRPVILVSPLPPGAEVAAVTEGLTASVSHVQGLERLLEAFDEVKAGVEGGTVVAPAFHLEVDTGMGRAGVPWQELPALLPRFRELAQRSGAVLEACFTHFHSADARGGEESVLEQWDRLTQALEGLPSDCLPSDRLRDGGKSREPWIHAANSAAIFRSKAVTAHGCRPGIFLFGGRPGEDLPTPSPVVSLRARIVRVEEVAPGSTVGYGATHRARGKEWWATVAVGYGDGLRRLLSNRGEAVFRGVRVPIVGRISMDLTVVECSSAMGGDPPRVGEVVTFLGEDDAAAVSLEEMAEWANTIHYEILTGFSPRLPRIWHATQ